MVIRICPICRKKVVSYLDTEELNREIEQLCNSKVEEFAFMGYENITGKEIWQCVSEKYDKDYFPSLHKIVNDILTLKVTTFMNWMTLQAYKSE